MFLLRNHCRNSSYTFLLSSVVFLLSIFPHFHNVLLLSPTALSKFVKFLSFSHSNSKGNINPLCLRAYFLFCNIFALYFLLLKHSIVCSIKNLFEVLTISLCLLSRISISLTPNSHLSLLSILLSNVLTLFHFFVIFLVIYY